MAKPTITMIIIAVLMGTAVLTLSYNAYEGFANTYSGSYTIDENYTATYDSITTSGNELGSNTKEGLSNWDKLIAIPVNLINSAINVFATGFSTLKTLFDAPDTIQKMTSAVKEQSPDSNLDIVINLIVTILVIWVGAMMYKAIKGSAEEP
jgi:hypothetical protein